MVLPDSSTQTLHHQPGQRTSVGILSKTKLTFRYNGILLSRKNETLPFAAPWMDLEMTILSKDKHYMILLLCGI